MPVKSLGRLVPALVMRRWRKARTVVGVEEAREIAFEALVGRLQALPDFRTDPTAAVFDKHDCRRIAVTYAPRYRNPYQVLFYGADHPGYRATPGTLEAARSRIATDDGTTIHVFHQHWLNQIVKPDADWTEAEAEVARFIALLTAFKAEGGILVWTVHNLASHENAHPDLELHLSRTLGGAADLVIGHNALSIEHARRAFGVAANRLLLLEHGGYAGVYPDRRSRAEARRWLGVPERQCCFLFLGFIRPYKGVEDLIAALSYRLGKTRDRRTSLVVVGEPVGICAADLRALAGPEISLVLRLGFVPDGDVQSYLVAADWMVIPFRKILTSGSAILALSYGTPLIVPRAGGVPEIVTDGVEGYLYDPEDPDGLEKALDRALATSTEQREQMARNALARATSLKWAPGRRRLVERIVEEAAR